MAKKTLLSLALIASMAPALAMAGNNTDGKPVGINFNGPKEVDTVAQLLDNANFFSERNTIVEGKLVKQMTKDTFMFSDGSGAEIRVEMDDDISVPQAITPSTKVRLYGDYELGNAPKIEVERVEILN